MKIKPIITTPIYALDGWQVVETADTRHHYARNATLFSLANGNLGVRGAPEDGTGETSGTFINGFYEMAPIHYPEAAYGFAQNNQTMLNVADATGLVLKINGQPILPNQILSYKRTLNLRHGIVTSEQTMLIDGQTLTTTTTRLVSLTRTSIFAQHVVVQSESFDGIITLESSVNADTRLKKAGSDPRVGSHIQGRVFDITRAHVDANSVTYKQATQRSAMTLACAVVHDPQPMIVPVRIETTDDVRDTFVYETTLTAGSTFALTKIASYLTNQTYTRDNIADAALQDARETVTLGFEALASEQQAVMNTFWDTADVQIEGDDALQQGIRFNLFHLYQSVGRSGKTNISAKGLTGEGYEGHYFWDTEMYVIPTLVHTAPDVVRQLLAYRYSILDQSRQRARELGHKAGASYAWRTINGAECSPYFPAGSAAYHINADIAYAIQRYVTVTGDIAFMDTMGAEILAETARLWLDIGTHIDGKGFCICCVTGPDEYTVMVDNNAYTNWMAQANLHFAVQAMQQMEARSSETFEALRAKIGLRLSEISDWQQAAATMYLPYDSKSDLYQQDDSYFSKPVWDFANTPPEHYPLMLHYHPLVIYRHQVCKQADLVLALFLLGEQFTLDQKKRHFAYYEAVTTHDSSLSACIFGIVASEIGEHAKAYEYFLSSARMDIDDMHHNVKDGVHIANMAGAWMCVVNGFAGVRVWEKHLHLNPTLPEGWQRYAFKIGFQGGVLYVQVSAQGVTYLLHSGDSLTFTHGDQTITLNVGAEQVVDW